MEFKLNISDPKTGKTYKKALETDLFRNKKITDKVEGDSLGLKGYELEITGGSDKTGVPMRKDLDTQERRKALLTKGVGLRENKKGLRRRKLVRGNTISLQISQINLKVVKAGAKKIEEVFGGEKVEAKEVKEAPKEGKVEKKEEKVEKKPKEVKEEKKEVKEEKVEEKKEVKEEKVEKNEG